MAEQHIGILQDLLPDLFDMQPLPAGFDAYRPVRVATPGRLEIDNGALALFPDPLGSEPYVGLAPDRDEDDEPREPNRYPGDFCAQWYDQDNPDVAPPTDHWGLYLPYHIYDENWWGVYLLPGGIAECARLLTECCKGDIDRRSALSVARLFVTHHLIYHHRVEAFASRLETTHQVPLYIEDPQGFVGRYRKNRGASGLTEDTVANAYAYRKVATSVRRARWPARILDGLCVLIDRQPDAYRDALMILEDAPYVEAEYGLADMLHEGCGLGSEGEPAMWGMFGSAFTPFMRQARRVHYLAPGDGSDAWYGAANCVDEEEDEAEDEDD